MNCPHCGHVQPDDARFCGECGKSIQPTEPATHSAPRPKGKPTRELIGREIAGRYRIIDKLGEGGMGAVYHAEQISLKRKVALKLLRPELSADPGILRRFNAEAELAARLNHPNTVTLYDFGQDTDGTLFIAMEFIEGRSLRDVITTDAPVDVGRALRIIEQVCDSLANAHSHGIVHRDLKPDNVMLSERGREKEMVSVLDFGIAKLRDERADGTLMPVTQAGDMVGTPQYMAPEQIRGEEVDGRTDIYAVGAMLYEMITGRLPFEGPTLMAILSKHLTELPEDPARRRPDLNLPPAVSALIMSTLQKPVAARPRSMEELASQIGALRQSLGVATPIGAARPAIGAGYAAAPPPSYGAGPMAAHSPAPRPPGVPLTHPPGMYSSTPAPQVAAMGTPAPSTPVPHPTPPAYAPTQSAHTPYTPPAMPTPAPAGLGYAPPAPSSTKKLGLFIGLGGLVIAGAALAVYLGTRGGDDDDGTPQTENNSARKDGTGTNGTGSGKPRDVTDPGSYDLDLGRSKAPNTRAPLSGTEWREPSYGFSVLVPDGFSETTSPEPDSVAFTGTRDGSRVDITVFYGSVEGAELTDDALLEAADAVAESLDGRVLEREFRTIQNARRLVAVVDAPQYGWRYEFVIFLEDGLGLMARIGTQTAQFDGLSGFRAEFFERRLAMPSGGAM